MKWFAIPFLAVVFSVSAAAAQDNPLPAGFKTQAVLKSTKTADGDALALPQTKNAEIVSVIGTIERGGRTPRHQHPIPVYVYVLTGELEVRTEGHGPRHYKAGQAFMESVNRWHQAFNKADGETKILVVFIGEEGKPTTITSK